MVSKKKSWLDFCRFAWGFSQTFSLNFSKARNVKKFITKSFHIFFFFEKINLISDLTKILKSETAEIERAIFLTFVNHPSSQLRFAGGGNQFFVCSEGKKCSGSYYCRGEIVQKERDCIILPKSKKNITHRRSSSSDLCQHIYSCKFTLSDRLECWREISSLRCFIHALNAWFYYSLRLFFIIKL